MHPGSMKMYQDLKTSYWWSGMKRDVLKFVTKCIGVSESESGTSSSFGIVAAY